MYFVFAFLMVIATIVLFASLFVTAAMALEYKRNRRSALGQDHFEAEMASLLGEDEFPTQRKFRPF